jgi:hypothetical protein
LIDTARDALGPFGDAFEGVVVASITITAWPGQLASMKPS